MAKYNFHKQKDNEQHKWIIVRAISQLTETQFKEIDPCDIEITLLVNGNEIDFLNFIDIYISQVDKIAERKAKAILEEQLSRYYDILCSIELYLKDKLERIQV